MIQTQLMEQLIERIPQLASNLQTEEATKHALVLPFLQAMGYDPFNPGEIAPEYTADFGLKSGEKVDYAILQDGEPIILIECKKYGDPLDASKASQIGRYFNATDARIGILTDGVRYLFYSDLEQENRMDQDPFLSIDRTELDRSDYRSLRYFTKGTFDLKEAIEAAANLKYIDGMQHFLENAYNDPQEQFVRMMAREVYSGLITQQRLEKFTHLTRVAFQGFVNDRVTATLKKASDIASNLAAEDLEDSTESSTASPNQEEPGEKSIVTTAEEIEGYEIVQRVLSEVVSPDRLFIRDTASYCSVILDNTNRQAVCRFYFDSATAKHIRIMNGQRSSGGAQLSDRYDISDVNDIADYRNELVAAVRQYFASGEAAPA